MTPAEGALRVDFVTGAVAHRLRFGGGRGQDLAKAMGLRAGKTPKIVDATAGLGRDSFLLASLGAEVTMIERCRQHLGLSERYWAFPLHLCERQSLHPSAQSSLLVHRLAVVRSK